MDFADLTNLTVGFLILLGGVAMGLRRFVFGNGGNGKNGKTFRRCELASTESKKEIDRLWDEKQGKEHCEILYDGLKEEMGELKAEQKYLTKLMTNVAIKVNAEVPR